MSQTIELPASPRIPGLRFRGIDAPGDYLNMNRIIKSCSQADGSEYSETVEDIANYYGHIANCDLTKDILFVEINGEAIGYSRVWFVNKSDGPGCIFQFFAMLTPEWRGKGIRESMLSWCEARIKAMAEKRSGPMEIVMWVNESEKEWREILSFNGYEIIRWGFTMVRPTLDDIPGCPLPEGIEIRPVTPSDYRKVWDADVEASQDSWIPLKAEEEWYRNWLNNRQFQPDIWAVAWDGNRVAGAVQNYIDTEENSTYGRKRGWTENIHVGREWRGRGIAQALIARSYMILKEKGMTEAALGVDALNPTGALHLYKKMGFLEHKKSFTFSKPVDSL